MTADLPARAGGPLRPGQPAAITPVAWPATLATWSAAARAARMSMASRRLYFSRGHRGFVSTRGIEHDVGLGVRGRWTREGELVGYTIEEPRRRRRGRIARRGPARTVSPDGAALALALRRHAIVAALTAALDADELREAAVDSAAILRRMAAPGRTRAELDHDLAVLARLCAEVELLGQEHAALVAAAEPGSLQRLAEYRRAVRAAADELGQGPSAPPPLGPGGST